MKQNSKKLWNVEIAMRTFIKRSREAVTRIQEITYTVKYDIYFKRVNVLRIVRELMEFLSLLKLRTVFTNLKILTHLFTKEYPNNNK